jgi:hypothetical protein
MGVNAGKRGKKEQGIGKRTINDVQKVDGYIKGLDLFEIL